ncbi:HAMP domain-containing sensor histidine kinase [Lysinibacillus irui]|uniref:histidine kinase n=1 Tax=Lysinibacillus irui TaxID=2998077 RepID=A0ABU5NP14_9BACI|nr:HAMP domain-containing sensor histidine kinase [Lysinibacillus irui]MEA0555222.1 HAMP domain-containing sensor histidine kinase [Lysinibacillus irui]MEA0977769.1 HAMP domain-containing sensor histidine kinase [Lysinibacillus irui]MEA1043923.1 HAMP domain-containing sensor histidine kinase [Lysinibacillus irui]
MTLKNKYRTLLFLAIVSVPLVILGISVTMSILYDKAIKMKNDGTPFHESFAYPLMLFAFVISFALLALLFSTSIHSLLKKITMLNNTIRELASNERIPETLAVTSEDEIGQLIQSVNLLIERTTYRELELAQQQELQKELLQKLRHDIHTPLTAIRLQLFYLEDQLQEQPKLVESLTEQIHYITNLTNEFQLQSFDTSENAYVMQEEVQLAQLLTTMIKKWRYLYRMQNIALHFHPEDAHVIWISNELWLQRLFDNVFQNTLKHAQASKLEVIIKDGQVIMSDDGIGFTPKDAHDGLGLKIIQDIAKTLHIEAFLQSNKDGTTFRFTHE